MSEEPPKDAGGEPFRIVKGAEETNGEFVRFEGIAHPSLEVSVNPEDLSHHRYMIDNPDEHIHPHQEEYIKVLSGKYMVAFGGTEHELTDGDEITIPKNRAHRHWNPGNKSARVIHEHRPALQSEELFETFYVLAQAGNTDEKGIPNPLQFAVVNNEYPGHAYTTGLPISLQKALFTLLAPIGRLAGYKAKYTREDIDELK